MVVRDIPVAVKNTFPPQFSASKASNPPPPDPGVRRLVIAWIPCSVPARINTVFKGSGGSISAGLAFVMPLMDDTNLSMIY